MNHPTPTTYLKQRDRIEHYFDRTAADTWARLTSTAPVSGVRATVRAGRDRMRATLLSWLPQDLRGRRLLDAEVKLEALISADLVEILTDADGNFTYRMTKAGVDSYREQLGIEPNNRDISFMEFARISQ